ncbi:hypothetical protein Pcinc_025754 [Petrolisthes cinctipes]|uniref:Uncharacterized protein n=1 Tax=Petrolisthes cinctipes TaxID=88211 RepID=A0AAE1KCK5_PETCI|nr:hypothetical protein Pcinc_025754 [Petrolisthes cinctipes]
MPEEDQCRMCQERGGIVACGCEHLPQLLSPVTHPYNSDPTPRPVLTTFILLAQPPLPLLPVPRPPELSNPNNHTLLQPSTPQLYRDRGGSSSSNKQEKRHLRGVTSSALDRTRTPV